MVRVPSVQNRRVGWMVIIEDLPAVPQRVQGLTQTSPPSVPSSIRRELIHPTHGTRALVTRSGDGESPRLQAIQTFRIEAFLDTAGLMR